MLTDALHQLIDRKHLSEGAMDRMLQELLDAAQPELLAAFLVLLRSKGETVEEIKGIVKAMQRLMIRVHADYPVLDIAGTGGDKAHTVNISTGAAIVAASCGVKVAKHGNRSVSSLSGSADVLEALGIPCLTSPEQISACLDGAGIGFIYAPHFHPAMQKIAPVRRSLKVQTIFNLLGPLLNPASAQYLLVGVYHPSLVSKMAHVLFETGIERAIVYHGSGIDELSTMGTIDFLEVTREGIKHGTLSPSKYGLPECSLESLRGGSAVENARILETVFQGFSCPLGDTLALNAGVAQYIYGSAESIEEGIAKAQKALKEGVPYQTLQTWRNVCKQF